MTSTHSLAAGRCVLALAGLAAWATSLVRQLVHHEGVPAVYVQPVVGMQWWRVDVWLDREDSAEHCLRIDALGWQAEVFYRPNA